MQIEPAELQATKANDDLNVVLLDGRNEAHLALLHMKCASRLPLGQVKGVVSGLLQAPPANTITILRGEHDSATTQAWKRIEAESVSNAFILKGGISNWIHVSGGGRRT